MSCKIEISTLRSHTCSTSESEISEDDFDFLRTETWNNGSDMEDAEESDSSGGIDSETEQREESGSSGGTDSETEQRLTPTVVHPTLPKQLKSLHADPHLQVPDHLQKFRTFLCLRKHHLSIMLHGRYQMEQ